MIQKPENIVPAEKKIRMLIAGYPGIGKSTLALSAPRPLHIDCDFGIDRVEPQYRKPFIQPGSYAEILNDLQPGNLTDFDTLVFDTGGKLITLMSQWAIQQDNKYGQRDGSLSLKGYGFVGREFVRLMDYCFYQLKKHIVIIFHATEEKDGDNTRLRIKVEGQTKNNVWEPMDLGGFVEMMGNDRTIGFSNCERYFAKGTRGIHGIYKIPDLATNPNTFLTWLFEQYNQKSEAEVAAAAEQQQKYTETMAIGRAVIESVTDAESANQAATAMKTLEHALTSEAEIKAEWVKKMQVLGLTFDKATRQYVKGVIA
ncbi:MAG: ATP-binding protein [Clostridia bacterium]|nr:ATP-binding protein [Clostridia bacterium]